MWGGCKQELRKNEARSAVQGPPETSALLVCCLDGERRAFALPGMK